MDESRKIIQRDDTLVLNDEKVFVRNPERGHWDEARRENIPGNEREGAGLETQPGVLRNGEELTMVGSCPEMAGQGGTPREEARGEAGRGQQVGSLNND